MEPSDEGSIERGSSSASAGAGPPVTGSDDDPASGRRLTVTRAAYAGGTLALASTLVLVSHLAGRSGLLVGWGFALAAVALAVAASTAVSIRRRKLFISD